ncbi:MAG: FkbM family methyltransferase [Candidatus Adlerbacteria bacterium]|nr:FkbM family methyltransferase [Candidatus Adlerbacteria bacterium]
MQRSVTTGVIQGIKQDLPVFVAFVKVFWIAWGVRSRFELIKLFGFTVWKRTLRRKAFVTPFKLCLSTPYGAATVRIRDMADITTVCAVFVEGEYDLESPIGEVKTVLDLGSNIGVSVEYFRLQYPAAHIYAVEADPTIFKRLQENCSGMDKVELIHAAIANKIGPIEFHTSESSVSGSLYERGSSADATRISGFTIDDLIEKYGIGPVDILKFDIEGAEFDAFPASPLTLHGTRVVMGEVHPDIGNRPVQEFLDLFSNYTVEITAKEKGRFILKAAHNSLV